MTSPSSPSKPGTWRIYFTKRLVIIGLFGFSSGLPLLLTMSTLTWWLANAGLTKQTIGLFGLATIPYAYKFLWAPFVDRLPLPFLTRKMGRRRSWLLFSQIILAASIALMGTVNPIESPALLFIFSLLVAFWSATQDIVIDAYRIQSLTQPEYAAGAAMEVNGYRLGMMVAGAGALALSDDFSWSAVYGIMALMLVVGIVTTFFCPEPNDVGDKIKPIKGSYGKWLLQTYWGPFKNFMQKPGWLLIIIFILIYKMGDNLLGNMATVFYKELGFTGAEVGTATKFFGSWMTILGSFLIGFISYRHGIMKSLFFAGVLHLLTNGMFIIMDHVGHNVPLLYSAIALENTSNGMMIGSFVAYLSSLCSVEYTATQYALLSSMMAQCRTVVQALSGWIASLTTWTEFFIWAMVAAIPGLLLLLYLMKKYPLEKEILPRKGKKKG